MSEQGKLILLSGYSGVGKNTIITELKKRLGHQLTYIPSYTTRPMRDYEQQGNPYIFVSPEFFNELVEEGYFAEYNVVHGYLYGTPIREYRQAIANGNLIIKDIDVEGAIKLKQNLNVPTIDIFIDPPSLEELKARLYKRGETEEGISKRLERIELESSHRDCFTYHVVNDILEDTLHKILTLIK